MSIRVLFGSHHFRLLLPFLFAFTCGKCLMGNERETQVLASDDWEHSETVSLFLAQRQHEAVNSALERDFPLRIRLHRDDFEFDAAQPQVWDIRFTSIDGVSLDYEIED